MAENSPRRPSKAPNSRSLEWFGTAARTLKLPVLNSCNQHGCPFWLVKQERVSKSGWKPSRVDVDNNFDAVHAMFEIWDDAKSPYVAEL